MKAKLSDLASTLGRYKLPLLAILLVVLAALPLLGLNSYILRVFCLIFTYSILTISLNLITGYLGQTSMGHAALYSIGAYAGALCTTVLGANFWLSLVFSILCGVIAGAFEGFITMNLSGSYMTVTTLAFAQVMTMVAKNWTSVTNGTLGIKNIPQPTFFGIELTTANGGLYWLALGLLVVVVLFVHNIMSSRFGRAIAAIRDDELAAKLMGVNTRRFRVADIAIAGGLAGIAGCYYAHMSHYIDPNCFTFDISMTILTMVIFGGMASLPGSIIGAAVMTAFPEALRFLATYRFLIYGFILVIMMRVRPQGALGGVRSKYYKLPKGVRSVARTESGAPIPEEQEVAQ